MAGGIITVSCYWVAYYSLMKEAAEVTLDCTLVTQSDIFRKFDMECTYLFTQLMVYIHTFAYINLAFHTRFNQQCFNYLHLHCNYM